jgi:hypothetical protein
VLLNYLIVQSLCTCVSPDIMIIFICIVFDAGDRIFLRHHRGRVCTLSKLMKLNDDAVNVIKCEKALFPMRGLNY